MSETKQTTAVAADPSTGLVGLSSNPISAMFNSEGFQNELARILPTGIDVAKFVLVANSQFRKNKALLSCTKASVYDCMAKCARLGVMPDGRNAYLIPYGQECTLQFDYKGLVDLVLRNRVAQKVYADVVCANDEFVFNMGVVEKHIIKLGDRGEIVGAYAMAEHADGTRQFEVIDKATIEKVRSKSKNANRGPWVDFYSEMCKKVVFKRLTKWLKLTPEIVSALEVDNKEYSVDETTTVTAAPRRGAKNRIRALEEDRLPAEEVAAEVYDPVKVEAEPEVSNDVALPDPPEELPFV